MTDRGPKTRRPKDLAYSLSSRHPCDSSKSCILIEPKTKTIHRKNKNIRNKTWTPSFAMAVRKVNGFAQRAGPAKQGPSKDVKSFRILAGICAGTESHFVIERIEACSVLVLSLQTLLQNCRGPRGGHGIIAKTAGLRRPAPCRAPVFSLEMLSRLPWSRDTKRARAFAAVSVNPSPACEGLLAECCSDLQCTASHGGLTACHSASSRLGWGYAGASDSETAPCS